MQQLTHLIQLYPESDTWLQCEPLISWTLRISVPWAKQLCINEYFPFMKTVELGNSFLQTEKVVI